MNPSMAAGVRKYVEFHQLEPTDIMDSPMDIPPDGMLLGAGVWITYRSGKWGKGTYDYIHDFGDRVRIVTYERAVMRDLDDPVRTPKRHREAKALVRLGACLGFEFERPDGERGEAKTQGRKPDLYCTTSGRALFVVQDKRRVVAGIWGGKLGVEERGIVH